VNAAAKGPPLTGDQLRAALEALDKIEATPPACRFAHREGVCVGTKYYRGEAVVFRRRGNAVRAEFYRAGRFSPYRAAALGPDLAGRAAALIGGRPNGGCDERR
jgi:hypothetical protein